MRNCYGLQDVYKNQAAKKREEDRRRRDDPKDDDGGNFEAPNKTVNTIFGGIAAEENRRDKKLAARRVMNISSNDKVADVKFRAWSEHPITFSREDQWATIPYSGRFPLVLDAVLNGVRFTKLLVDGGSSINILFGSCLAELGISQSDLRPVHAPFWGVVPGNSSMPLGEVTLTVQFGTPENFRKEPINFLVADFDNAYHAILGRPALARFRAIPHYTYLVLKMPAKRGILSLRGNIATAFACEKETLEIAEAIELSARLSTLATEVKENPDQGQKIPEKQRPRAYDKSRDTKAVSLGLDDPSKTVLIGTGLDPK